MERKRHKSIYDRYARVVFTHRLFLATLFRITAVYNRKSNSVIITNSYGLLNDKRTTRTERVGIRRLNRFFTGSYFRCAVRSRVR